MRWNLKCEQDFTTNNEKGKDLSKGSKNKTEISKGI
jgi:hypothetical protein